MCKRIRNRTHHILEASSLLVDEIVNLGVFMRSRMLISSFSYEKQPEEAVKWFKIQYHILAKDAERQNLNCKAAEAE